MKELTELLRSQDENERKQAIVILSKNPTKENLAICKHFAESDPHADVRLIAQKALKMFQAQSNQPTGVVEPMQIDPQKLKQFLSGNEKEKLAVIQLVVNKHMKQAVPALVDRLKEETDPVVLSPLILALGKLGDSPDVQHIVPFFDNPDPSVRAATVESAVSLGTAQEHILRLILDPENRVRQKVAIALKSMGPDHALPVIRNMVGSDSAAMKSSAAFVLRFFPDEKNVEILETLLDSPDLNVRNNALKTLEIFRKKGIEKAKNLSTTLDPATPLMQPTSIAKSSEDISNLPPALPSIFPKNLPPNLPSSPPPKLSPNLPSNLPSDLPSNLHPKPDPSPAKSTPAQVSAAEEPHLPPFILGSGGQGSLPPHLQPYGQENPPDPTSKCSLDQILCWARTVKASDVHITPGRPVLYRQFGLFKKLETSEFTVEETKTLLDNSGIAPAKLEWFQQHGDIETVIVIPGAGRFRVTVMKHLAGCNITARVIPLSIRSFEESGMPVSCKGLINWAQGLVLVTGSVGSGKTSSLATLVEMINQSRNEHIITIEEPIEIVFEAVKCQISQREIGFHTLSQSSALRGALREDPDVLVVSELRDLDNIQLAISAAETGHLVFGTMNTINAARTVSRLTDSFPPEDQAMLQNMLSESLRGIVCQQLIPKKDGTGVVPAYEVLIVTTAVSNMIRKEGVYQLASVMTLGKSSGMVTMDQSLKALVESGVITGEEAYDRAELKKDFEKYLPKRF